VSQDRSPAASKRTQSVADVVAYLRQSKSREEVAQKFFRSFMGRSANTDEIHYFMTAFYPDALQGELDLDLALKTFFESKEFLFRSAVHAIGADRDFRQLWARGEKTSLMQLISWALQANDVWLDAKRQEMEQEREEAKKAELRAFKQAQTPKPMLEVLGVTISPLGLWGSQE
jgi:hypothetical protein